MRKLAGWVLAVGLTVGAATGCSLIPSGNMKETLKNEAVKLEQQNYHSTAMMTVQMDNTSQVYYIETSYEGPDQYKIALGDANKNINQIIVRNKDGMFVVSPQLQKVFRFNGNWAQNQGHIYLYDQVLQQLANSKDLTVNKGGGIYTFEVPVTPENDVVVKQRVQADAKTMKPKTVQLLDKSGKAIVVVDFKSFDTGVRYKDVDFDPHQLAQPGSGAKTTMTGGAESEFGYILPTETYQGKLTILQQAEDDSTVLRYSGDHGFTLEEFRPNPGVDAWPLTDNVQLVDLYGVPALYTGDAAHRLVWLYNGVQFDLVSSQLTLDQMRDIAISTLGQVGK
jgi:outer membrane lipoprotein-sorting protein